MKEQDCDDILIGGRIVGANNTPFIIAEMSGNHNQSLDTALELVEIAANAGAHALKIQTYTADTMTIDINEAEFRINTPDSLWYGQSLYQLYKQAYTPWEWHKPIFDRCKQLGIIGFSTPFDESAVDFLEELNVPLYKIASFENTDIPLIEKVAATGKPMIISTGMASEQELAETVSAARASGCHHLVLLKCTSTYPAEPINTNIRTIPDMQTKFDCQVGLSDHTLGIGVAIASISLGATVIEKHFTKSRAAGGVDAAFSMEPAELESLVLESERAWSALGNIAYGPTEKEKSSLQFRRSLYITQDMQAGDILTSKNLRTIRPGFGLPPKYYNQLLGCEVNTDITRGTPVSWKIVK